MIIKKVITKDRLPINLSVHQNMSGLSCNPTIVLLWTQTERRKWVCSCSVSPSLGEGLALHPWGWKLGSSPAVGHVVMCQEPLCCSSSQLSVRALGKEQCVNRAFLNPQLLRAGMYTASEVFLWPCRLATLEKLPFWWERAVHPLQGLQNLLSKKHAFCHLSLWLRISRTRR